MNAEEARARYLALVRDSQEYKDVIKLIAHAVEEQSDRVVLEQLSNGVCRLLELDGYDVMYTRIGTNRFTGSEICTYTVRW